MLNAIETRMQKSIHALKDELSRIRTGRAHVSLLDHVTVNYYDSDVPLSQVASLSAPEPRMIQVSPWEKSLLPDLEKAILASNIGLNPSSDGEVIRLILPELNEDRRHELVRQVGQITEGAKVSIRNIRRDENDSVKKDIKAKEVSEDEGKALQEDIQKLTDRFITEIETIAEHKERDILTV
ncbi:MAG: ribosome recycling factor [Mariprofundaceae bacterium]